MDFIWWITDNIGWFIAGIWLVFSIMNWAFEKLDVRIARQKKQEKDYWEKRKIIRWGK